MNSPTNSRRLRVGDWVVEPTLDQIARGADRVKLEPRIMKLLMHLADHPGRVVSVEELLDSVWAGVVVSPESVYQYIARLRKALGDDTDQPRYIATIQRKGYRLIATVTRDNAQPAPQPQGSRERTRWRLDHRVALAAILICAGVVIWALPRSWLSRDPDANTVRSIAVLPFTDLSADGANQPFCDGLAEEVLNSLAEVPELRVVARASTFALRSRAQDTREVGRQLDATHLVKGIVLRSGDRIRIAVQLIRAADGYPVWSHNYDGAYADVMKLQQSIASSLVGALNIQLSTQIASRLATAPTTDIGAYEFYLLGRHANNQRTPEAATRAIGYQRQAMRRDPAFALAYVGLAEAYIMQFNFGDLALAELSARVPPLLDRALELDALLPEAHAARGSYNTQIWNLEEAKASLRRAIVLNPNYADAHLRLGIAFEYDGQPRAALEAHRRASRLDPLNFFVAMRECMALLNLGLYAEAGNECEHSAQLEPSHPNPIWVRGVIAAAQGRTADALGWYQRALLLDARNPDIPLQASWLYRDLGDRAKALEMSSRAAKPGADRRDHARVEHARLVAADDPAQLAQALDPLRFDESTTLSTRLAAASLRVVARANVDELRSIAESLAPQRTQPADLAPLPNIFDLQWGWSSALDAAVVLVHSGRRAQALTILDALEAHLDKLESNGHVSYGFHYIRAASAALRRHDQAALGFLERAHDLGWRRVWWARIDPAFDGLRKNSAFQRLLARAEDTAR